MKEQERTQVATQIADLLNGLDIHDAISVIAEAEKISAMNGNLKHSLISVGVCGKMIGVMKARAGVVSLEDGGVIFSVQNGDRMLNFKITQQ
jgi:hypothetical protein